LYFKRKQERTVEKEYTNMRRLKRIPAQSGLTFTLETAQERKKDNLLCNYCGWKEAVAGYDQCQTYSGLEGLRQEQGLGIIIRTCQEFQPVLTFRPPLGQYESEFNTFRLGSAWYNRVSPGTIVALYDTTEQEIFGKAQVLETHHGSLQDMCEEHAHNNHLFLDRDPSEAPEAMYGAISKMYGHIAKKREGLLCTVIYLENIKNVSSD
jgi:hypothetical protein